MRIRGHRAHRFALVVLAVLPGLVLASAAARADTPLEDQCEWNGFDWDGFASDGADLSVSDETWLVKSGSASIRLDTQSGFDTGLFYPALPTAHWDLTGMTTLVFWEYGINDTPYGFQGPQPIVVLLTPTGTARYEPDDQLAPNYAWRLQRIPLAGGFGWTRIDDGDPDFSDVNQLEIHHDTWDSGFSIIVDGLRFHDHEPGTLPPEGPPPPQGVDPDAVPARALLFIYDPIMENLGGMRLHEAYGWQDPVALAGAVREDLATASHGRALYEIVETVVVDDFPFFEDGFQYDDASYHAAYSTGDWHRNEFDYARFIADAALAKRVERGEIDEVWVYGAPYFEMWESTMAGEGGYWCNSGPVAGVPSERLFVVMGWNYERGVAEALHSWGHRAESVMDHSYGLRAPNRDNAWNAFSLIDRNAADQGSIGDVHFPVNGDSDYDYCNERFVLSDCDCWYSYPDLDCPRRLVNCDEWSPARVDPHREYMLWYYGHMPSMPGVGTDFHLANWWRLLVDVEQFKSWDGDLTLASGTSEVTITAPENSATVAGLVPVTVRVAADSAVGRVDFLVDWAYVASDFLPPYRFLWDASALTGYHEIQAVAYDLQNGTESYSWPVALTIAPPPAAPPEVSAPGSAAPLRFTDRSTLTWEDGSSSGATRYNVYRGNVRWLDDRVPFGRVVEGTTATIVHVGETPAPGAAWCYVVTGVNGGGEGTPGSGAAGERPLGE